jgi:hypothetical protein
MRLLGFGKFVAVLLLTFGALPFAVSTAAVATPTPRVTFSDPDLVLNEGDSQAIQVSLPEPIVCDVSVVTCDVTLDLTSAFPAGVTVTPASLNWTSATWIQQHTVTISIDSLSSLTPGTTYNSTALLASPAAYYNNYQPLLSVTVPDLTPTPTPDPTDVERTLTLSMTGGNESQYLFAGAGLVAAGAVLRLVVARRKR